MLETAKKEGYAYPAVNVTTIEVINGALRAFSEAKSDGIIQVSIGGGKFASGSFVGNSALGAIVLAEATRRLAEKHNVLVALHTDHCQPEHVDTFLRPLIAESRRRVERGEAPLFNSHMLDASTLPMAENLKLSRELLRNAPNWASFLKSKSALWAEKKTEWTTPAIPPTSFTLLRKIC